MATKKTNPLQTYLVRNPQTGDFNVIKMQKGKAAVIQAPPKLLAKRAAKAQKHIVILGGGISGLTAAYDLLKTGQYKVTIVEANNRTGGRSLTLRNGDSFTEVINNRPFEQTCKLDDEGNGVMPPYPPYLNAGPGRIPSAHYHVLNLCKELQVDLEVYVMQSRSNLVQPENKPPMVNRRVANDTLGHIANDLFQYLENDRSPIPNKEEYRELLAQVGALTTERDRNGRIVSAKYTGSQRAGFEILPGAQPGKLVKPIEKRTLLNSHFWEHHFYQPEDFLWQPTSFQPVGGMDMIEQKLVDRIKNMGGVIMLNAMVSKVVRKGSAWEVFHASSENPLVADICLSNIPIPLLKGKVEAGPHFDRNFWINLSKVMDAGDNGFLAPTCKVGWQAERELWQKLPTNPTDATIPIFGGISYTSHPMTQMWYPSDRFHDKLGVLTGAYNYGADAERWGNLTPTQRLREAREGAEKLHGSSFARELKNGVTIAWQNIPTQKGGWADWSKVGNNDTERLKIMNAIRKGSNNNFFVIGDQVSWLPGWKEGAVAIAQEVVAHIKQVPNFAMLQIQRVPDTKALIEGHRY